MLIRDIDLSSAARRQLGDIDSLAASIERVGLLHPVIVTGDGRLIVGRRRVEAFKRLGRESIPSRVVRDLSELAQLLDAQLEENICREPYQLEEAAEIGKQLEATARRLAAESHRAASRRGGRNKAGKTFTSLRRDNSKRTARMAARAVGVSHTTYLKLKAVVASKDRALIDEMNRKRSVHGAYYRLKIAKEAAEIEDEAAPKFDGKFRVIACDPPWRYGKLVGDPTHRGAAPYPTMTVSELRAIDVAKLAKEDSILWLWTTNAHIWDAREIAEAWGFAPRTILTWVKNRIGTGEWLRGQSEHCLLCVRGNPLVRLSNQTTVLHAAAGTHSAKPDSFYELVEKLCPGSKLELFQRRRREGWQALRGNLKAA
jgi:N6-adenosine-specific RNA methylase IME4